MPKSKVRKKSAYTPPSEAESSAKATAQGPSHPLYLVVMFGLMLIGLVWIILYYIAVDKIPFLTQLGNWNMAIGFALMIAGLLMTMRWR